MNTGFNFDSYMRGGCVVETGNNLRGPPRRVKVSVGDPNETRVICCCWPRGPSFTKVAGFRFDQYKSEATLQEYTSLESLMYMDSMAFLEYWAPGENIVKVSVTQRCGKKIVLFGRLSTFLDEMRDRQADKFVLLVTETKFNIVTKDRSALGCEVTSDAPKNLMQQEEQDKVMYSKCEREDPVNSDYMTSLFNSFKKTKVEPVNTPQVNYSFGKLTSAPKQQSTASRPLRCRNNLNTRGKRVRVRKRGKRRVKLHIMETIIEEEEEEEKFEGDHGNVEEVPPVNTTGGEKDDTEREKESGGMSEMQLVQEEQLEVEKEGVWWGNGRLPTTSEAEEEQRDTGEVTSVLPGKENAGEVTSILAEEEETQHSEKDVEKEDMTKKVNVPSLTKLMSSTKAEVRNKTRRLRVREVMLMRKKRKNVSLDKKKTTEEKKNVHKKKKGKNHLLKKRVLTGHHKKTVKGKVSSRWRWWSTSPPTPEKKMTPKVKAKKELPRKVFHLKKKRKAFREKKKRPNRINFKSVRCRIDARNTLTNDCKPMLDLKVLGSQPPPPGPARVKWAREVAALKARQRSHRHTSGHNGASSLDYGQCNAKH